LLEWKLLQEFAKGVQHALEQFGSAHIPFK
jgi:hypothetical protein